MSVASTTRVEQVSPDSRLARGVTALVRIAAALLWIQNVGWKVPPDFGQANDGGLYHFIRFAVDRPVFAPYAWVVEHVVLPHFTFFGWVTLLTETALGAFLLIGLATRFWALVGVLQSLAITLSVLNAPNEWHWSYFLMIMVHLLIFATAAGRSFGVDGVLRPVLRESRSRTLRALSVLT